MSAPPLERLDAPLIIEPAGDADAAVIWLHGLGADGNDFEPIVAELGEALRTRTRFVFPHAPMQPVTINGGTLMRAWYDIAQGQVSMRDDETGIRASEAILRALIAGQIERGVPGERIVVAGFSQGGAIALHTGLRYERRLAGIMALSTYLPGHEATAGETHPANRATPIFMAHGSEDPLIPLGRSEHSRAFMSGLGLRVEVHTYPMPHSVCAEEVRDIDNWLERILLEPGEIAQASPLILPG